MFPYERLTIPARYVLDLANSESEQVRHPYTGPEHILMAMMTLGSGGGAALLDRLGVQRADVERRLHAALARPDRLAMQHVKAHAHVGRVLDGALDACDRAGRRAVGTVDLLFGIIGAEATIAGQVLADLAVTTERATEALPSVVTDVDAEPPVSEAGTTPPPLPFPSWSAPPADVLGVAVPGQFVLARSAHAVISVDGMTAYPEGFEFRLAVRLAPGRLMGRDPFRHDDSKEQATALSLSIAFPTGRTLEFFRPQPGSDAPMLAQSAGISVVGSMDHRMFAAARGCLNEFNCWVWPLPPPGPLTFVCDWPAQEVATTRHVMDGDEIGDQGMLGSPIWSASHS